MTTSDLRLCQPGDAELSAAFAAGRLDPAGVLALAGRLADTVAGYDQLPGCWASFGACLRELDGFTGLAELWTQAARDEPTLAWWAEAATVIAAAATTAGVPELAETWQAAADAEPLLVAGLPDGLADAAERAAQLLLDGRLLDAVLLLDATALALGVSEAPPREATRRSRTTLAGIGAALDRRARVLDPLTDTSDPRSSAWLQQA